MLRAITQSQSVISLSKFNCILSVAYICILFQIQDSQRSVEAANHLLNTNRSNNADQDHIVSQEQQLPISSDISPHLTEEDVSLNVTIASDNIQIDTVSRGRQLPIQEDTTCNTIIPLIDAISNNPSFVSNLNNNNRIDIKFKKRQLYKEKEDTYISSPQCFAETNNSVTSFQKKPWSYSHISIPVKRKNRIYSSRSKENPVTLKNPLDTIKSNDNQDSTIFQGKQLFVTGKSKTFNIACQEDTLTTSLIDTVPQAHQLIAGDTSGNLLYHKNIVQTCYFSSEESNNQEPVNSINYDSQAGAQFSKKYNNQLNNQSSNQTNKLISSISQQVFLELSLLNKNTTPVLTVQIPTKIVRKEERSNQQSSIKLSIDSPKYKVDKMLKRVKIAIVGAGASGIAAASRLSQEGINDFVVLEANDRIGGRINTVDFGK